MAISNSNSNQQYNRVRTFVPLDQLPQGTGASNYVDDVTDVLLGIEPRDGSYEITDDRTGQVIQRPNSWTAHFASGAMFSWPTYLDRADGTVKMWSRFDSSINLAACIQQGIPIHLWRDERKFVHLELAQQPAQQAAPKYQPPMNPGLPW